MRIVVRSASALVALAALISAGCGDNSSYANTERPATPVTLTAAIGEDGIRLSPTRVGAGTAVLIVANVSGNTRRVTVETDTLGSKRVGMRRSTGPISPRGTAKLQLDLQRGRYRVHLGNEGEGANLLVGKRRPGSSDDLLLP